MGSLSNNLLTVLIPMAGEGKRFINEGYLLPKPLIEVSGIPMVIKAVNALPKGYKYVFICHREHLEKYKLDELLQKVYSNITIIPIDYKTEGQASTCLLSEKYINPDNPLLIGPCDNGMTWNLNNFLNKICDEKIDALIWTFRNNITVQRNPQMYGWINVENKSRATKISCKIPISDNPVHDHAIVGTFWFRRSKDYFYYAKKMIEKDRRINNEFYVDEVMNELIEDGLTVEVFEIDKYICWGTPNDLKIFNYWEDFFINHY